MKKTADRIIMISRTMTATWRKVSLVSIMLISTLSRSACAPDIKEYCQAKSPILITVTPSIIQKIEMACLALAALSLSRTIKTTLDGENEKKWQAPHIAPLQPLILA